MSIYIPVPGIRKANVYIKPLHMNDIDTGTVINQHEKQQPNTQKRLKGLLALLPESGTLYQRDVNHDMISEQSLITTKITSRKQQRRRMKRYQQEILRDRVSSDPIDVVESCNYSIDVNDLEQNVTMTSSIQLANLLNDKDIAVLYLFDPYQPYSLQLLQKLLAVCRLSNESKGGCETDASILATTAAEAINTQNESNIHCLVVSPCTDAILTAKILENTGAVLLPWMENDYWKIAMGGANVCPSILAIIECSKGRNVFPIHHEEFALDWNTSIHVYNSWFRHCHSAFTTLQRIQLYALYPTASLCIIQ